MARAVLALDQGTTSSRALLFDASGSVLGVAQREFTQHYPRPGWVEHDPLEIWSSQLQVARDVLQQAGVAPSDVAAVGITNQRETTIVWERATLRPIHPAIVWQDRRTAHLVQAWKDRGLGDEIVRTTGLVPDAYFSASKIAWLLDEVPGARAAAERGELAFGTVDAWLIAKATDGAVHVTDVTNASRTMVFDIHAMEFSQRLLDAFGIPASMMPTVAPSSHVVASLPASLLGAEIPVAGIAGDQQAATFGQACFTPGTGKNTYGTGCFMTMNTGATPVTSKAHLLTTVAWDQRGVDYALEGSVFTAGAVVQWLRDGLGIIETAAEVEGLARSVDDAGGVVLVPAFAGLGAPQWDPYARGTILGLTRGSTKAHVARAALEAIALQVHDVARAMEADSGLALTELKVDGGAARNDLLMQIQADLLGVPIVRPKNTETTALGAAFLAGLAVGFWPHRDAVADVWALDTIFEPRDRTDWRTATLEAWNEGVARSLRWAAPT